jgi:hypothetical protein
MAIAASAFLGGELFPLWGSEREPVTSELQAFRHSDGRPAEK